MTSDPVETTEKPTAMSYKDKVLSISGFPLVSTFGDSLKSEEIVQMITEEICPEIGAENEEADPSKVFNPKPEVKISLEEYEQWCRSWKNTFIVRLLCKK